MYLLIWQGEVIDEFETLEEAREMRTEYEMAYGGTVEIRKSRR